MPQAPRPSVPGHLDPSARSDRGAVRGCNRLPAARRRNPWSLGRGEPGSPHPISVRRLRPVAGRLRSARVHQGRQMGGGVEDGRNHLPCVRADGLPRDDPLHRGNHNVFLPSLLPPVSEDGSRIGCRPGRRPAGGDGGSGCLIAPRVIPASAGGASVGRRTARGLTMFANVVEGDERI